MPLSRNVVNRLQQNLMFSAGFTGSRKGVRHKGELTAQGLRLRQLITILGKKYAGGKLQPKFHHGMCIGGDKEAGRMARIAGFWVVGHPPIDTTYLAKCIVHEKMPAKGYIPRNHDIARSSKVVIATPKETLEQQRGSGTWATIRFCIKQKIPLAVIWPNGKVKYLNGAKAFFK